MRKPITILQVDALRVKDKLYTVSETINMFEKYFLWIVDCTVRKGNEMKGSPLFPFD